VRLGATVPGFANAGPAAARAIGRAGLHGLEDRLYVELSGGERQRVHFARALCQLDAARTMTAGSRALLLDEPTANLDLAHQVLLLQQSQDESRSGHLVVAVLHDLNLAARWADRVLLMTAGQIVGQGAPRDIIRDDLLAHAYGCTIRANCTPSHGMPFVLPQLLELDR
jgi:iron complex transport system ATP-binding protein